MRWFTLPALLVLAALGLAHDSRAVALQPMGEPLFREGFDDPGLIRRGWYDGTRLKISPQQPHAGKGSIEYHFPQGASGSDTSTTFRRRFEPSEAVYLAFSIRFSKGWGWTGRNYHPHLIQFMTTENGPYHGPASSHLTLYVEPQEGRLRLAAQDIQNKDRPHGLTQGPLRGGYNGKFYDSPEKLFTDDRWHRVEAEFKLNTLDLAADRPNADGVARAWVDGRLVVDRKDVIFRSTDFPKMQLNQLLLAPYFGSGLLPHEQTLWIDDMVVARQRPAAE